MRVYSESKHFYAPRLGVLKKVGNALANFIISFTREIEWIRIFANFIGKSYHLH